MRSALLVREKAGKARKAAATARRHVPAALRAMIDLIREKAVM
jgi:hypothetical protein